MVNTKKQGVNNDGCHDDIFKYLRLHYFEALKSEAIDGLNWDDFRIGMNKKPLYLDPLLLFL